MIEKKIRIEPDHENASLFGAFGLTEEDADDILHTIVECMTKGYKISEVLEKLVEKYDDGKLVIALYTYGEVKEIMARMPGVTVIGNEIEESMSEAFRRFVK